MMGMEHDGALQEARFHGYMLDDMKDARDVEGKLDVLARAMQFTFVNFDAVVVSPAFAKCDFH